MGWKNVKEHYGIKHIVQVTERGICIGSPWVHNILTITPDLHVRRSEGLGRGEPFDSVVAVMEADPSKLAELINSPDSFTADIPVFTFTYDGEIVEEFCETPGWPHLTHGGEMMYNNTHFLDRSDALKKARVELNAVLKLREEQLEEARAEVERKEGQLRQSVAALARLAAIEKECAE